MKLLILSLQLEWYYDERNKKRANHNENSSRMKLFCHQLKMRKYSSIDSSYHFTVAVAVGGVLRIENEMKLTGNQSCVFTLLLDIREIYENLLCNAAIASAVVYFMRSKMCESDTLCVQSYNW